MDSDDEQLKAVDGSSVESRTEEMLQGVDWRIVAAVALALMLLLAAQISNRNSIRNADRINQSVENLLSK